MSLSKMAPLSWQYYAEEIGGGREDYYAVGAGRPGRFLGRGAEALGIAGEAVSTEALERLFGHGCDPHDSRPLGRSFSPDDERKVAGFALTFSPPKTVSVLWALGDDALSAKVLGAHEAAVEAAIAFLEDHAAFTRRGHGGLLQVDTEGLIAASFVHRTSRAADPQLHTHLLVANKVRALDGRWLALDARELFEHQKAAGMLYKAALRSELMARCGVSWSAVDDNGIAEVEGVPDALCEAWSARRQAVKALGNDLVAEREANLGRQLSSAERAACFQVAAYRTRAPKVDAETPTAALKARWHDEAVAFGHEPERWLAGVLGHGPVAAVAPGVHELAVVVGRLEERSATWGRADVVEECARLVSGTDATAVRELVEALADEVLRDPEVVSLAAPLPAEPPASLRRQDETAQFERHGAARFTTTGTLRREAAVLEAAAAGKDAGAAVVPDDLAEAVLSDGRLGEDQQAAVRVLLTGGEQFALLVGPAGAGKSRALEAARRAWKAGGYEVVGLAPSAMAAAVLEEASGIASETLAKFLHDLERQPSALSSSSVVVLDEAGMARTDDLARLVEAVKAAEAKLVLVGDPNQLGAVGPGGLFRTLVDDHGAHELETVRRFANAWEAAASLRLRSRDPSILPTYLAEGRLAEGSRSALVDEALSAWRAGRAASEDVLVMTGDNESAAELARRCRAELVAEGVVESGGVRIASGLAGVGDEVVTLRNDRRLRPSPSEFVRNGARWRVTDRGEDGSLTVVPLGGEGVVTLPADYVAEHVGLAYALTVHKAQGTTSERAVVLVDEAMTAAQLYVGMSRGRQENRALVLTNDADPDEHARRPGLSGMELLIQVMRRDGGDASAHEVLRANLVHSEDRELLNGLRSVVRERIEREAGPDLRGRIAGFERRDDLPAARAAFKIAEQEARDAERRRLEAESRVDGAPSLLRGRLPGALGGRARHERAVAEGDLTAARWGDKEALRRLEACRHRLSAAERLHEELDALRARQERRAAYFVEHADEIDFVRTLARRLRAEAEGGASRAAANDTTPTRTGGDGPAAEPSVGLSRDERPTLEAPPRSPVPRERALQPPPRVTRPGGPSLGA